ncbi:MAG: type IV pili twitching motility protein PilT [Myxococcales bacterium]|nr:type IV pili twitching motility protein PilT [Myxococcales bacterium]
MSSPTAAVSQALERLLSMAVKLGASDVHLKAGSAPRARVDGTLVSFGSEKPIAADLIRKWAEHMTSQAVFRELLEEREADFAYQVPGLARFRVNAHHQRGAMGLVMRVVPQVVRGVIELGLPDVLNTICEAKRGLVLVTGATGSGKSTTLAAMVDHVNTVGAVNIVTIEDPIEFAFRDKSATILQREVGMDTKSFAKALRSALRQDPDVILIGEMRDLETIKIALTAAETGHLVFSTLHTSSAVETVSRIISAFPPHQQENARRQLANTLLSVVTQRLVPAQQGGRIAACEILRTSSRVRELIVDAERTLEIHESMELNQVTLGTQSFDQALMSLMNSGKITREVALSYADSPDDMRLKLEGVSSSTDQGYTPAKSTQSAKGNPPEHSRRKEHRGTDDDGIERF